MLLTSVKVYAKMNSLAIKGPGYCFNEEADPAQIYHNRTVDKETPIEVQ